MRGYMVANVYNNHGRNPWCCHFRFALLLAMGLCISAVHVCSGSRAKVKSGVRRARLVFAGGLWGREGEASPGEQVEHGALSLRGNPARDHNLPACRLHVFLLSSFIHHPTPPQSSTISYQVSLVQIHAIYSHFSHSSLPTDTDLQFKHTTATLRDVIKLTSSSTIT